MLVKEFKESTTKTNYQTSGQWYDKDPRGCDDLDTKINEFLNNNQNIQVIDIKYKSIEQNVRMQNHTAKIYVSCALLMYEEI